ncbi:uncharacterized protein LOC130051959 isoform X3 [Ostrea edulis]|uniref:uncharacterized protein LOC130051959 isoform X3 n=1 Tax=Ostrea edulis TaxID=37623 RepID=UPI0024AEF1B6|nr:uncharacterized protein LOC130051959 isoform X3 [Ostrea edulis]
MIIYGKGVFLIIEEFSVIEDQAVFSFVDDFQEYVTWMEVGKSLYSYCGQRWSEESMSLCLSLSININILLEHTAAPALTRGVIKHGTTSINFPKDVHNQILQLLHYSEYLDHRQMRK